MDRKGLKERAKKLLKRQYRLLFILCLFAGFSSIEFGASFMTIKTAVSTQITRPEEDEQEDQHTIVSSMAELAKGDEAAMRHRVEKKQEEYQEHSGKILGRQRGVFSLLLNYVSSGAIVLTAIHAIRSLGVSSNMALAFLILASLLVVFLVWLFMKETFRVVMRRMLLESRTYEKVPLQRFMYPIQTGMWPRVAWSMLVVNVYQVLWNLTVVGGVIKYYSYYMVPYIVAENPSIRAKDAIALSRRMMDGHKWDCFVAEMSFLGWELLNLMTLGLSGIFFSNPYKAAFFGELYAKLREETKSTQIPGSELLADVYLYEKADETTLRSAYEVVAERIYQKEASVAKPGGMAGFLAGWFGIMLRGSREVEDYEQQMARNHQRQAGADILEGRSYPGLLAPVPMKFRLSTTSNLMAARSYTALNLVLMFFLFSFIGWSWEVVLHLISDAEFVNRGVLHGPWLPIYGAGGILILLVLKRFRDQPVLEFITAVILCGSVEYGTAWGLEMTHGGQKWWDYTGYFLNLHGRICAEGLLIFGLGGLAIVYLVAPSIDNQLKKVSKKLLCPIAVVLLVAFFGDQIYSQKYPNTGEGITSVAGDAAEEPALAEASTGITGEGR